ncbi:MAG: hypothetical protein GWQ08_02910 [Verrucomicrobiaceae bacterium]|nr:hypothetical protein [Verrucomicrobiaceae bacterium]
MSKPFRVGLTSDLRFEGASGVGDLGIDLLDTNTLIASLQLGAANRGGH